MPERGGRGTSASRPGSTAHFERLRDLAQAAGSALEPEGLDRGDGPAMLAESEEAIYAALELPWIPPGDSQRRRRDRGGPTRGTARARLARRRSAAICTCTPSAATAATRSRRWCRRVVALGYEYMAITDHSPHSAASRNLSTDSVKRQADEIARLRERFPQITILHGCEVDILPDGRLDFSDRVLERFDIVLASLHEGGGQSPDAADAALSCRHASSARHADHAPDQPPGAAPARLRSRLRPALRRRGRDRHGRRDRRRAVASRSRRRARAPRHRRRGDASPSTATATAPRCSSVRCSSGS